MKKKYEYKIAVAGEDVGRIALASNSNDDRLRARKNIAMVVGMPTHYIRLKPLDRSVYS